VIEEVLGVVVERLRAEGVDAEMIPVEVWWRRSYDMAEPALLQTLRDSGAASVLWVEMRFGFRERFSVACHGPDGRRAWRERRSGGSGFTDLHRPHDEFNTEMVDAVLDDVAGRVGDPCLPAG
ncbi:MAG: hypothetical protein R3325_10480, partial [Thermoanaerobaculia bacterium]|nr:hypothetical protein [Thermoanaerobaculia bacterium]